LLDSRLKVYEGLYSMAVRNFSKAADLFLETVSTFTSYELMDYKQVRDYLIKEQLKTGKQIGENLRQS
jgi:26S proteasome regulatory subunit N7